MRITRQTLLKIARDTVSRRTRRERSLLAAYLRGSLLGPQPVLGGTADIDLVFVHNGAPPLEREIERLTDEVHLDIAHHDRAVYRQGRELRQHPWLGPTLYDCLILHDPQHFMDFLQAGVRGLYHRPDYVLSRAQQLLDPARQTWLDFYHHPPQPDPQVLSRYLTAVENAANALASLNGAPLPRRRLMLEFPARAEAAGRPGLHLAVLGLLGGTDVEREVLQAWLAPWEAAMDQASRAPGIPPGLHPARRPYYRRALEVLLEGDQPPLALWLLLTTWTLAACHLPPGDDSLEAWQQACGQLGLIGEAFADRVNALDAFLDTAEETLETWGRQHGA